MPKAVAIIGGVEQFSAFFKQALMPFDDLLMIWKFAFDPAYLQQNVKVL